MLWDLVHGYLVAANGHWWSLPSSRDPTTCHALHGPLLPDSAPVGALHRIVGGDLSAVKWLEHLVKPTGVLGGVTPNIDIVLTTSGGAYAKV